MTMGTTSAFVLLLLLHFTATAHAIGINYSTLSDNLPPPANFVKTRTTINRVKIYDVNLQAFATVTVIAPNGNIVVVMKINSTQRWVVTHVKPLPPQTKINYKLVICEYAYA
ncbi:Glucan endo-1,3-beta-glucosidase 7 [Spatholobus suberectus]|nr:Glucan endo-1,3-beta-glucosidase 7 [Spatholobus suberectus]